jgi:hypothetical protein
LLNLALSVSLSAPDALKIITENDHVLLFWKSLALKEKQFNETRVSSSRGLGHSEPWLPSLCFRDGFMAGSVKKEGRNQAEQA